MLLTLLLLSLAQATSPQPPELFDGFFCAAFTERMEQKFYEDAGKTGNPESLSNALLAGEVSTAADEWRVAWLRDNPAPSPAELDRLQARVGQRANEMTSWSADQTHAELERCAGLFLED